MMRAQLPPRRLRQGDELPAASGQAWKRTEAAPKAPEDKRPARSERRTEPGISSTPRTTARSGAAQRYAAASGQTAPRRPQTGSIATDGPAPLPSCLLVL